VNDPIKPEINFRGFNWLAPMYDPLSQLIFGNAIKQSQRCTLGHIPPGASVLIVGGGTGWLLAELVARTNPRRVVYLEGSRRMLELSRRKTADPRIDFRQGTEEKITADETFDVIITHFLLDLYEQPYVNRFVGQFRKQLSPGGLWLCADFERPDGVRSKIWQRALVAGMYAFFRLTCRIEGRRLPDYRTAFIRAGFVCTSEERFFREMIASRVWKVSIEA
jgi:tRNA (cmo5U34)-methyltransferase